MQPTVVPSIYKYAANEVPKKYFNKFIIREDGVTEVNFLSAENVEALRLHLKNAKDLLKTITPHLESIQLIKGTGASIGDTYEVKSYVMRSDLGSAAMGEDAVREIVRSNAQMDFFLRSDTYTLTGVEDNVVKYSFTRKYTHDSVEEHILMRENKCLWIFLKQVGEDETLVSFLEDDYICSTIDQEMPFCICGSLQYNEKFSARNDVISGLQRYVSRVPISTLADGSKDPMNLYVPLSQVMDGKA